MTFLCFGPGSKLGGVQGTFGESLVQSQLFSNHHHAGVDRGSQIPTNCPTNTFSLSVSTAIFILLCDCNFFEFTFSDARMGAFTKLLPSAFVVRLTAFVVGLNARIVAQLLPLGLLCAAARVSILQCRSTSGVFREDWPSQESSSSGSRPMMCPSS
jgi:hypothetical protein